MGYRTVKRVLGETSLERKSRFLFGACLLVLIGGAFWWVESIAEDVARNSTQAKARDLVDFTMLQVHAGAWRLPDPDQDQVRELAKSITDQMVQQRDYRHKLLHLDGKAIQDLKSEAPKDEQERQIVMELKKEYDAWLKERRKMIEARRDNIATFVAESEDGEDLSLFPEKPIFRQRLAVGQIREYQYYAPVFWEQTCYSCHLLPVEIGVEAESQLGAFDEDTARFRVMKIMLPYEETQDAIDQARAILIAVGILTVFVAMVALYVIFRYVVVKPLHHLRDVSEQVSRGKTEVRADIHTGDEFEQLAESFNRMLRHMTDAQTALQTVNTELDTKVDQLARLNLKLYEMNRVKSDFLANMSHELRTPLNSIIGFSEVLQGLDSLSDRQKRYALNIQKSGRLLLDLINDILDLAKMEAGKMEVRPTEFSIDTIVHAQCDMIRTLSEEKNIDLHVDIAPDLPPMFQDQGKIQQILTNLISNGVKFTPEGGRITVSASRDAEGMLVLTVADTGVGIPDEDREVIFEKFRQASTVSGEDGLTREFSGTGLGLSIVKEITKLLEGEIDFESEVGTGTTFYVVIPWNRAAVPEVEASGQRLEVSG